MRRSSSTPATRRISYRRRARSGCRRQAHPADPRSRRSHHRRGGDQGRVQRPGLPASGRRVSVRSRRRSRGRCSGSRYDSRRRSMPITTEPNCPLATMSCRCTTRPDTVPAESVCRLDAAEKGQPPVRRRHALCRIDRTHRSPGRRLRRADAVDHASALSSR